MAFYNISRNICKFFLFLFFNIKFEGLENIPLEKSVILISNHRTYMDPVFLGAKCKRRLVFIAKKELFEKPILGFLIKKLNTISIDRDARDTKAIDKAISFTKDKNIVCIFPEGTRSKNGNLKRIKSGASFLAMKSNVDILPACIKYNGNLSFRKKIIVKYGKVIKVKRNSSNPESNDIKYYNEIIQNELKSLLGEQT